MDTVLPYILVSLGTPEKRSTCLWTGASFFSYIRFLRVLCYAVILLRSDIAFGSRKFDCRLTISHKKEKAQLPKGNCAFIYGGVRGE